MCNIFRVRRIGLWIVAATLGIVVVVTGALGFGLLPSDAVRLRSFGDAVRRWQANPDHRAVAHEYVTLGVEAMQARWCGVPARDVVMAFRSLPGLPEHLAVNDTSAAHYDAFARGELSAYFHLTGEQGIANGIGMIEQLATHGDVLTDDQIVAFLASFQLPVPTVTDAGAIAGVRRLLADVQPNMPPPLTRTDIAARLLSRVEKNLATMTRAEQTAAFATYDAHIRATDPQPWRSKQISDFLAGIWAQGYGQIYLDGINGFFAIQRLARIVFVIALLTCLAIWTKRRRRLTPTTAVRSADGPLLSLAAAKPGSGGR
jgi:hypothetical protein